MADRSFHGPADGGGGGKVRKKLARDPITPGHSSTGPQTRLSHQQRCLCSVSLEVEPQTPSRSPGGCIMAHKIEPFGTMRTQWYSWPSTQARAHRLLPE